jgi:dihydrofolate reductase
VADLVGQFFLTLDGVVQAPGHPDEDRRGDFQHGGWHLPYLDEVSQKWLVANNGRAACYLLGRRTYDLFKAFWPTATEEQVGPLAAIMNGRPKWVVSRTLTDPLDWAGSHVLPGDVVAGVRRLKDTLTGGEILLLGSVEVAHTLLDAGLVDRLELVIDPIVLGTGARLFDNLDGARTWTPTRQHIAPAGSLLLTLQQST